MANTFSMPQPLVIVAAGVASTADAASMAGNPDMMDCSSPLSSPPPSSVIDALLDLPSSPPSPVLACPPDIASPPRLALSSPASLTPSRSREAGQQQRSGPESPGKPGPPVDGKDSPAVASPSKMVPTTRSMRSKARAPQNGKFASAEPATDQSTTSSVRKGTRKRTVSAMEDKVLKPSPSEAAEAKRRKREAAKWQTSSVLSDRKSPLANHDIRALLCNPEAWTVLSKEEQKEVLALFPSDQHILHPGTDHAQPNIPSLRNDDNFRADCARYRSDLQNGFHDKEWLVEAFEAYEMRKEGVFDEYVVTAFEDDWGVPVPDEHRPASMRAPRKEAGDVESQGQKRSEQTNGNGVPSGEPAGEPAVEKQQADDKGGVEEAANNTEANGANGRENGSEQQQNGDSDETAHEDAKIPDGAAVPEEQASSTEKETEAPGSKETKKDDDSSQQNEETNTEAKNTVQVS